MKKAIAVALLSVSTLLFGASTGSVIRVAYVDLQLALQTVEAGRKAKSQLEKEVTTKKTELEKEQAQLQKEAEEFEKKAAILNEAARSKKQGELQRRLMEFQRKAAETQMNLQQQERTLTKPLLDELRAIIEGIGKERGYQLIIEKNEGAVLYAESGSDLTDEVIKRFNEKKGKKG